jgi:hypothetical protein
MRCDSWGSLLAHTLASLWFGCEPKAKVATRMVIEILFNNKFQIFSFEIIHISI